MFTRETRRNAGIRATMEQPSPRIGLDHCDEGRPALKGQLQATPLTLKLVGEASLEVQVPWKPNDWLPPAGMVAL